MPNPSPPLQAAGRWRALTAVSLLAMLLSACGFQLRGSADLPPEMQLTRIEIQDPYSIFSRRLQTLLEQNGVQVVEGQEPTAILEVPVNQVQREVLTIGDNARVREYRVTHRVSFRLLDAEENEWLPLQELSQSRVISFNERDILASTREEEFLRQDLADTLSRTVLRRLSEVPR